MRGDDGRRQTANGRATFASAQALRQYFGRNSTFFPHSGHYFLGGLNPEPDRSRILGMHLLNSAGGMDGSRVFFPEQSVPSIDYDGRMFLLASLGRQIRVTTVLPLLRLLSKSG